MLRYESMKKPLKHNELDGLVSRRPLKEHFGPGSKHPYLSLELDGSDAAYAPWLKTLPCPVIGIGEGPLSHACDVVLEDERKHPLLARNIVEHEIAAMILVQHLRISEKLSLAEAVMAESFAYATVQKGPGFLHWLSSYEGGELPKADQANILSEVEGSKLSIALNRPDTRNAIGTDMRVELCLALELALADSDITEIELTANGASFSIGGAIEEFGEVSDPATAHWVRNIGAPAGPLALLAGKLKVHVNGAAIGAGAEMLAFGDKVTASSKAWFQLPELKYGLIPGAGGTASIPRRIGRQKTAYMALSMEKIRAETALEWGLVDAIID